MFVKTSISAWRKRKIISIPLFTQSIILKILPLNLAYTAFRSLASPVFVKVNNFVAVLEVSTVKSVPMTILFPDTFHMFSQTSPKLRRTRIPLKTDVKCFKYSLKWKGWLCKSALSLDRRALNSALEVFFRLKRRKLIFTNIVSFRSLDETRVVEGGSFKVDFDLDPVVWWMKNEMRIIFITVRTSARENLEGVITGYWSRKAPNKLGIVNFITSKHYGDKILPLQSTLKTLENSFAAGRQRPLTSDQIFWRPIEETKFGSESRV